MRYCDLHAQTAVLLWGILEVMSYYLVGLYLFYCVMAKSDWLLRAAINVGINR